MRRALASLVLIPALLLTACTVSVDGPSVTVVRGSGVVITDEREVSNISALAFSGLGEVIVTQGQTESLTIEAEENIVPQIKAEMSGGTLRIGFNREKWQDWISPTKPIKFHLAVKDLTSVESSGLGSIHLGDFKSSRLSLKLSGAGNIKITALTSASVATTISGAGSIELGGSAPEQTVTLSGLGSYQAGDLSSQTAKITLSGAGSATVWASETLNVSITGAGSVNYYGSPAITKSITGVGVFKGLGPK